MHRIGCYMIQECRLSGDIKKSMMQERDCTMLSYANQMRNMIVIMEEDASD